MVAERLKQVLERIGAAAIRGGRNPDEITLVAVTKGRSVDQVLEAYGAGQRHFGENRAQELVAKAPLLPSDIHWHFIGPLQRNKVGKVRPLTVLLHSLDRISLAQSWARGGAAPPALLEVNVGGEPQKHGFRPLEAREAASICIDLGIDLLGVMTMPPQVASPDQARPWFEALVGVRDQLAKEWPEVRELSMGMTDDFEVAVEMGATLVRVGRAIFGAARGT